MKTESLNGDVFSWISECLGNRLYSRVADISCHRGGEAPKDGH
jgi:hypothetical protein